MSGGFARQALRMGIVASFGVITGAVTPRLAHAADEDDIYVEAYGGASIDDNRDMQLGAVLGYVVADAIGVGLMFDQYLPTQSRLNRQASTVLGVEGRWFLEPFEASGLAGVLWAPGRAGDIILGGGGAYLWALSSSLAARFEIRAQFPLGSSPLFVGNLGFRILF